MDPKGLYLDLLKKTLSYALWPEPPMPFDHHRDVDTKNIFRKYLNPAVNAVLGMTPYRLMVDRKYAEEDRIRGKMWPGYADTMIGLKRLENLQACVETVLQNDVDGDLIETGVWRGGSCIFMRAVLKVHGDTRRKVYAADSFEGLPRPDGKYPADMGDRHYAHPFLAVSQATVEHNFRKYGLLDDQVVFIKGWFKDTLPTAPIGKLSVLRLDGDLYSSTIDVLNALYPKLSPGGFCIIDDYHLQGCKQAVNDYRTEHGISERMLEIDDSGVFWRKGS